jgi:hypothetical protein
MADAAPRYAHLYRAGIFGYIWLAPVGCHMNVGVLNLAYKHLLQADAALAEKAAEGRGVHPRISTLDSYVGNNWAKMPCFLVELGFMSNVQDDVLLSIPEHQQQLAEALAEGSYRLAIELGVLQPEQ